MAKFKSGLGRGINTLIPTGLERDDSKTTMLRVSQIEPNRHQPRKTFNEEGLKELAESMKKYGVIQPIVVCEAGDSYEIVAGERRWRAARLAGLKEIPVIINKYSEQERMEVALIENIQRQDLNPIEEAMGFKTLMEEYDLTQEELSDKVFKSRAAIANSLRLLNLPKNIQSLLTEGKLSSGHARALLSLKNKSELSSVAEKIITDDISVRQTEELVRELNIQKKDEKKKENVENDANYARLEQNMSDALGAKVSIKQGSNGKGRIEISYVSMEDLDRLYGIINSSRR